MKILDFDKKYPKLFIIMEFCDGGNLMNKYE